MHTKGLGKILPYIEAALGTVFEFGDVFCFTYFLRRFLFRVRGKVRVKVGVGGGFRVRVSFRARRKVCFIHFNPNLLELKLRPSGKPPPKKKQKKNKRFESSKKKRPN